MNRIRILTVAAVLAAGCSGGSEEPGALLYGPAALAVFDGVVEHETSTYRQYLAVASERGDELRLVDLTDNEVVSSPGLVFPLSIPTDGRPAFLAAADLNDGDQPDALAVIPAGSDVLYLVDTWSGHPTVLDGAVPLESGAIVRSMLATPLPSFAGDGTAAAHAARFVIGYYVVDALGNRANKLAIVTVRRPGPGPEVVPDATVVVVSTTFAPLSLAFDPAGRSDVLFAATRDVLPGTAAALGAVRIELPASGVSSFQALAAGVPTDALAVATFDSWAFPVADDAPVAPAAGTVQRVIVVPSANGCGTSCGLIALDPAAADPATDARAYVTVDSVSAPLIPIRIPAGVNAIAAAGRTAAALLPIASGAGTFSSTGLAVVTATDGGIYFVDLLRWRIASESSPTTGTGKTRASAASLVAGATEDPDPGSLGLWRLGGQTSTPLVSSAVDDLVERVRVTPGFTPTDDWTLAWKGILPGLETRGATLTGSTKLLTVAGVADLSTAGVKDGDLVEVDPVPGYCTETTRVKVVGTPGATATLDAIAPATWGGLCLGALPAGTGVVATFRGGGLVLSGARSGLAGRPAVYVPGQFEKDGDGNPTPTPTAYDLAAKEFRLTGGERLFYVTDACASGSDCALAWKVAPYALLVDPENATNQVDNALTFPFPTGPVLGFVPGFVDAAGASTTVEPPIGTAIRFTTASGVTPTRRHPVNDGTSVASAMPSGLAIHDPGTSGVGVNVNASYTAGLVVVLSSGGAVNSMTVIH